MARASTGTVLARQPGALTPAQQSLVHLPTEGQFLATGAAGSGKSTVALARAIHLARQPLLHGAPRVLLLARTPALAAILRARRDALAPELARAIDVETPGSWCAARDQGELGESDSSRDAATSPPSRVLTPAQSAAIVHAAIELVRRRRRSQVLRRPLSFFTTEIHSMLLGLGVERFDDYVPLEREGRGSPLDDEARRTVFAVYEEFRALARRLDATPPLALVAAAIDSIARERRLPYDHVVIDDGDQLAPVELKLARVLAAGGSLTLLAALERRFDPLATSLRDLGLERLERTEPLVEVRRGTAPMVEAALAVLRRRRRRGSAAGAAAQGPAAELRRIVATATDGATAPRLVLAADWAAELDALIGEVRRLRDAGRAPAEIAVLTTGEPSLELAAAALARAGFATRRLDDDAIGDPAASPDAIRLGTLAAAAGREFPVVLVHDVNRGAFPRLRSTVAEHELATVDDDARRALYLAMTRATDELVLFATEATKSPLLPRTRLAVTPPTA